jgi:hypothetical protein
MTQKFTKFMTSAVLGLALIGTASVATAAENTKKAEKSTLQITANSTGQVQRAMTGMHIDNLPDTEESTKAVDNPNRIVCKKIEKLGSRLKKRKVCATKKEWDMAKTNTVNAVRQMQLTRGRSD